MTGARKNPDLAGTWPLFDEGKQRPFPGDPQQTLSASSPGETELAALDKRDDFIDSPASVEKVARRARESLPPLAPEWMRGR